MSSSHSTLCEQCMISPLSVIFDCDTFSCMSTDLKKMRLCKKGTEDRGILLIGYCNLISCQMRVSTEVKVILSVHPEQRTEQQLAKVCKVHNVSASLTHAAKRNYMWLISALLKVKTVISSARRAKS